ncbi:hypothetical protein L2E82_32053 [Cichorium intybus]|uniref:Uncharacterized protein n=1 Tax=Cichorium intybus TaxID=13427 RepID=A0ACB9BGG0_CICIN|nr:hypothetical protein L2E82_32053 [Cichorium intybus]
MKDYIFYFSIMIGWLLMIIIMVVHVLFVISKPDVFKSPSLDTNVIFAEDKGSELTVAETGRQLSSSKHEI